MMDGIAAKGLDFRFVGAVAASIPGIPAIIRAGNPEKRRRFWGLRTRPSAPTGFAGFLAGLWRRGNTRLINMRKAVKADRPRPKLGPMGRAESDIWSVPESEFRRSHSGHTSWQRTTRRQRAHDASSTVRSGRPARSPDAGRDCGQHPLFGWNNGHCRRTRRPAGEKTAISSMAAGQGDDNPLHSDEGRYTAGHDVETRQDMLVTIRQFHDPALPEAANQ